MDFVKALQSNESTKNYVLDFNGIKIKVSSINIKKIECITYGPKGGKKLGFTDELEQTEEELYELAETMKTIN